MKKVIIIMSALDIGGAQRFALNLCKYLNIINYQYQVVFLRRGKSEELKEEFKKNNISFHELESKSVSRSLIKLIKYLKIEKPDIILSTVGNVDFIVSIAKLFLPKTYFIIRKANVIFEKDNNIFTKCQLLFESMMCNKLISLTNEMKEEYTKYGFKRDKIIVINNMVDLQYIHSKILNKREGFEKNNNFYIVSNARMVPEKRHDILIRAFIELNKKRSDTNLLLLGDGVEKNNILKMIPESLKEKVIFMGFQNNPYIYMNNSDILLLTSDYEGFPNVIIEAFACGLPVIATNCKTGPKEIITNGYNGFVVETQDYQALAQKVDYILQNNERLQLMKENAKETSKKYDVNVIAMNYIECWENINDKETIKKNTK